MPLFSFDRIETRSSDLDLFPFADLQGSARANIANRQTDRQTGSLLMSSF